MKMELTLSTAMNVMVSMGFEPLTIRFTAIIASAASIITLPLRKGIAERPVSSVGRASDF